MVLDHVAQRAGLLVISAAALHADRFGGGDLHVIDIGAVPERLEDTVAEAERHNILNRLLAQIVVDPVDLAFLEAFLQTAIEGPGTSQIAAKWLFDDDAPPAITFIEMRCGHSFG